MALKLGARQLAFIGTITTGGVSRFLLNTLLARGGIIRITGGDSANTITPSGGGAGDSGTGAVAGGPAIVFFPSSGNLGTTPAGGDKPLIFYIHPQQAGGIILPAIMTPTLNLILTASVGNIANCVVDFWPVYEELVQGAVKNFWEISALPT